MEFNEKLRLLRKNAGLTQRQVADAVGVTYRTYQNYEAGASMPAGDTASRLAAALGVSTDTLLSAAPASAPEASDRALRALLAEMQALYERGHTPKATPSKGCSACSLKEICLPKLIKTPAASTYLQAHLSDAEESI